jgi:hypothetical protein
MIYNFKDFVNENLFMDENISNFINYIKNNKKNKIAYLLSLCTHESETYPTDSDINYLSTDKSNGDLLTYLSKSRAKNVKEIKDIYTSSNRTSIRIGRGIKKIVDTIKSRPNLKLEDDIEIFRYDNNQYFVIIQSKEISKIVDNALIIPVDYMSKKVGLDLTKITINITIDDEVVTFYGTNINPSSQNNRISFHLDSGNISKLDKYLKNIYTSKYYIKGGYIKGDREILEFDTDSIKFKKSEIIITNNINITDQDIEQFTNELLSLVKMNNNSFPIEEVKGEEIRKWYSSDNYKMDIGKLGNSCMSNPKCGRFFDIYVKNPEQVSMLILKSSDDKLLGRALLWKLHPQSKCTQTIFMDRVYTINDSDENIFVNYAIENGYLYRSTNINNFLFSGEETKEYDLIVYLEYIDFEFYPFLDTLYYLNQEDKSLSNKSSNYDVELQDTDGSYLGRDEDDDDDYYYSDDDDYIH